MITFADAGAEYVMQALTRVDADLRLYRGGTITPGMKAADIQEASFPGYRPIRITEGRWARGLRSASYPQQTFTRRAGEGTEALYGYYATDRQGNVLWAEAFEDGPYVVMNDGDTISVIQDFRWP